jgi:hypothetical protein
MSRSRRKHPVITDQQGHNKRVRYWKRQANKWARRHDLPSGRAYRKSFYKYRICDYWSARWNRVWYYIEFYPVEWKWYAK